MVMKYYTDSNGYYALFDSDKGISFRGGINGEIHLGRKAVRSYLIYLLLIIVNGNVHFVTENRISMECIWIYHCIEE